MATCSVVGCDREASTSVVLHQVETFGRTAGEPVCDEHNFAMSNGEPWANMPDRDGILMGAELDRAGLLLVDDATVDVATARYVSGMGSVPRLIIEGRTHGPGDPRTVEVLLTAEAAQQIADAVHLFTSGDSDD